MLITFKSKAAADIVMYKEHAQRILELLDKDIDRGIIVHTDSHVAITTIESAIANSRSHSVSELVQHDINEHPQPNDGGDHDHVRLENVSFASRAYPLLEMLRAANHQGCDVVWGV